MMTMTMLKLAKMISMMINDDVDHLGKDDDDDEEAGGVTDYNPYKVFQEEGSNG